MFWVPIMIAAAAVGTKNMYDADQNRQYAKKLTVKNLNRIGEAQKDAANEEKKAQQAVERFANRKRGILQSSIEDFISVYEKLALIEFQESDGIRELSNKQLVQTNMQMIKNICAVVRAKQADGIEFIADMVSVGGSLLCTGSLLGVATGLPVTVGAIGGAYRVLMNPMFLPLAGFTAITKSIASDAKKDVTKAQIQKKYANVVVAKMETDVVVLRAIDERARKLTDLLTKLNMLFIKSIKCVKDIIEKKGKDRSLYTKQDKEYIRNCLNLADAVKSVLDTPLFDSEGNIAVMSKQALDNGESYLKEMEEIMTA